MILAQPQEEDHLKIETERDQLLQNNQIQVDIYQTLFLRCFLGTVLYVGNLGRRVDETDIKDAFEKYGRIASIEIVKDPYTK